MNDSDQSNALSKDSKRELNSSFGKMKEDFGRVQRILPLCS